MKRGAAAQLAFKTEHSCREILQFVSDPDAPPLQSSPLLLSIPKWYYWVKVGWTVTNILATLASVGAMIFLSFPAYVDNDGIHGMNFANIVELVCVIFFVFDYIVRLVSTNLPVWRFLIDPANLIDLLSTLPFFVQLILASFDIKADAIRILFLFRAVRIIRLGRYHPGLALMFATMKKSADLLALIVLVAMISMLFVATAFFFAERTHFDATLGVWHRRCPFERRLTTNCTTEISPYQSIPESMYWALIVMTTVGNKVEAPTSDLGRAIAAVTAICGVFFFATPATVLATNYVILRTKEMEAKRQRKMNHRQTLAMKAQENLRRDLERAYKSMNAKGFSKIHSKRAITPACQFELEGVVRTIFEVIPQHFYVYEPVLGFVRGPEGEIEWVDDYSMTTSERVLTCKVIVDSDEARAAARAALIHIGILDRDSTEESCLVCADPEADILLQHDFQCSYPKLSEIVVFNELRSNQVYMQDAMPATFLISMPHLYPALDVIELLKETRLNVAIGMKKEIYEMYVPLAVDNIMASRLIRELYEIAYERPTDGAFIAYIHPADADMLLEGFCDQFIPTPTEYHIITNPFVVDQQVGLALRSSFPMVRLDWIPPEAANAFYRGPHMSVGHDAENEMLMEINLTTLSSFDDLGFGQRFRLQPEDKPCFAGAVRRIPLFLSIPRSKVKSFSFLHSLLIWQVDRSCMGKRARVDSVSRKGKLCETASHRSCFIVVPVEVIARMLEYLVDTPTPIPLTMALSSKRLVCKKWDQATLCMLENTLCQRLTETGEWKIVELTPLTKQMCRALHRMTFEVYSSIKVLDLSVIQLNRGETCDELVECFATPFSARSARLKYRSTDDVGNVASLSLSIVVDQTPFHPSRLLKTLKSIGSTLVGLRLNCCWAALADEAFVKELACLDGLKELRLECCKGVTVGSLKELAKLPQLRSLDVTAAFSFIAQVSHASIQPLIHFRGLEELVLMGVAKVKDAQVIAVVRSLVGLKTLSLRSCTGITDKSCQVIAKLPNLENLDLFGCTAVTDAALAALSGVNSLTELDLTFSKATNEGLGHLAKLVNLTSLNVSGSRSVSDEGVVALSPLRNLKKFGASQTMFGDAGLRSLVESCPKLTELHVSNCLIPDAGVAALSRLHWLTTLEVHGSAITNTSLQNIGTLSSLTALNLSHCSRITDSGIGALSGCVALEGLNLNRCDVSDVSPLRSLLKLTILGCITDVGVAELSQMRKLVHLGLRGILRLNDDSVKRLSAVKSLRFLSLARCGRVSDEALQQLSTLPKLCNISVGCLPVTDKGVLELLKIKALRSIDVSGCQHISEKAIEKLKKGNIEVRDC